eukprot:CAMPEP_0182444722 /NCGR_PEP_ID=MMETSP1172-20130603/3090_1 /TAXON_ID=708627 /ORGANISM="Timspurckia oligopyrenoides, Strain CCMP3278" /LENGTH=499 /DNA_ID=CAMNT_0024640351 /DNA_START=85 /DNA_END=1584 /DNA_ORIENTATION=-
MWDSATREHIEQIERIRREDFLSLLEKIHAEANAKCGISVKDGGDVLTVEQFTHMMEANLNILKNSNDATRQGYDAIAKRVKLINGLLGTIAALAGVATGAVLGGGIANASNISLRKVLECTIEQRKTVLKDFEAAWTETKMQYDLLNNCTTDLPQSILETLESRVHSDAPSAATDKELWSKIFGTPLGKAKPIESRPIVRFFIRVFTGHSPEELKMEPLLSRKDIDRFKTIMQNKRDLKNSFESMTETYEKYRAQIEAIFSMQAIVPAIGMCVLGMASALVSIGIAEAGHRMLSNKNKNLNDALEKLEDGKYMVDIAERYRELLQSFEGFFHVVSEESIDVVQLNNKWIILEKTLCSTQRETKYITELYETQMEFAEKQGEECKILLHTFRWFGVGAILIGSAVATGGASAAIAYSALGLTTTCSSVALGVAGAAGAACGGGGIASLCTSSGFGECEAGFKKVSLTWQEKIENLNHYSTLILVPLEKMLETLEKVSQS